MFTIVGADGKEYGPVSAEKINEWIRGGRANHLTRARRDGEADWKTLGDFPEFAPPATPPPSAASTPLPPSPEAAPASPAAAIPALPSAPAYAPGGMPSRAPVPLVQLAGRGSRLVAQLIDLLAGGVVILPGMALLVIGGAFHENFSVVSILGLVLALLAALGLLIYQLVSLTKRGQTLGKRLMDIKIVNHDDGANPGFVKAVLLRWFVSGLISGVPVIGFLYTLVDIFFIFRDDRRCVHDHIASTHVVKAH